MRFLADSNLLDFFISLTEDPWILSFLIMLATFILEDAATTAASLLTVNGLIPMPLAISALIIGIVAGDLGLYAIGYYGKRFAQINKMLERSKAQSAGKFLGKNQIRSIIIVRLVPGMRLPTYVAMGLFATNFKKFLVTVLFAVTGWTLFLFFMVYKLGDFTMDWPNEMKWIAIGLIFLIAFTVPQVIGKLVQKFSGIKK